MKAYVKKADADSIYYNKKITLVDLDIKSHSAYAKHFIGENCLVEFVPLDKDMTLLMGVDENGHAKKLPFNFFIDLRDPFADNLELFPLRVDPIVGNVVFIRVKKSCNEWDFEVDDITEEDYLSITRLLHPVNQKRLRDTYRAKVDI